MSRRPEFAPAGDEGHRKVVSHQRKPGELCVFHLPDVRSQLTCGPIGQEEARHGDEHLDARLVLVSYIHASEKGRTP